MAVIRRRVGPKGVRWQAVVRLAGMPPVRRTFKTQGEARAFARDEEARLQKAREVAASHSLAEAIERYVRTVVRDKSPTTQRSDKRLLRWWLERHGAKPLAAITHRLLADERDSLRGQCSGPTVNRYLAAISSVLRRASLARISSSSLCSMGRPGCSPRRFAIAAGRSSAGMPSM